MCEICEHITVNESKSKDFRRLAKLDPTRTTTLRNSFAKEFRRRLTKIQRLIVSSILTNDCFGLTDELDIYADNKIPRKKFQFKNDQEKVRLFMAWLNEQINRELLTVEEKYSLGEFGETNWADIYISDAYKRGVLRADLEMRKLKPSGYTSIEERGGINAVMDTPIHSDRLRYLYTRTFNELQGVSNDMANQISRILTQGIADGDSPRVLASKLYKVIGGGLELTVKNAAGIPVRTISAKARATMIARTEIIRAHHKANIAEYRRYALAGVIVQAEFSANFDDRLCEECRELDGKKYTLDEAEDLIPVHPNCRCIVLPYIEEIDEMLANKTHFKHDFKQDKLKQYKTIKK